MTGVHAALYFGYPHEQSIMWILASPRFFERVRFQRLSAIQVNEFQYSPVTATKRVLANHICVQIASLMPGTYIFCPGKVNREENRKEEGERGEVHLRVKGR